MSVYVRNHDGAALMPCTEAKARKLLEAGKAKIVDYRPFTIQLSWQCEGHVQEVTCGIDKGSSVTGLACVGNGVVLLAAEIHHRRDVKEKMDDRRDRRKSRRARRWYRPARFRNRASSKRSGRLPPSIKTNVEEVIRTVGQIPLPISSMQGKTHLYTRLRLFAPLTTVFGYETAAYRKYRSLPKTHIIDALCIATLLTGEVVGMPESHIYQIRFRPRQTRKRYHSQPQKGKGRVKYQVNEELEGFRKGDLVRVRGRYIKLINSIYSNGYLAFPRVKGEPNQALPRDCQVLERGATVLWEMGDKSPSLSPFDQSF
jgi:hypothetical protein